MIPEILNWYKIISELTIKSDSNDFTGYKLAAGEFLGV